MDKKFITTWFYASKQSEKRNVGILRNKVKTFYGERAPDLEEYSQRIEDIYNEFDSADYDVVNIIPIAMGTSENCKQANGNYVGDVGFSITRGAVVVGKKRQ